MRFLPVLLLAFALPGFAQDPTPDTTAAWRYFPLQIGNVWEYHCVDDFCDRVERRSVSGDTLIAATTYFRYLVEHFDEAGHPTQDPDTLYLRFDSLTATIKAPEDQRGDLTPCPLDAPFDTTLLFCSPAQPEVSTYGGLQDVPIGEDTVTTTLKGYVPEVDIASEYVAGVGYYGTHGPGGQFVLAYARVDGAEYGKPIVTAAKPPALPVAAFALRAYPNPFAEALTLQFDLGTPEAVTIEVFDVLGRRIHAEERAVNGTAQLRLDAAAWSSGLYLVRLGTAKGQIATARIIKR